jgi:integrase
MTVTTATINRRSTFRQELLTHPKLNTFLQSIKRGSVNTYESYLTSFVHFQRFLDGSKHNGNNPDSILEKLLSNQIDLYELLEGFISSLTGSPKSIRIHVEAVKSFLEYYDIEISSKKFKKRCRLPKVYREDEEALTAPIIRQILLACNNRRLKPYILTLISGGLRAVEGLSIRNRDITWNVHPVTIRIRKEYTKTRTARFCYISDEAARYLKAWIEWKYRPRRRIGVQKKSQPDDLVFTIYQTTSEQPDRPHLLYNKLNFEFIRVLNATGLTEKKDGSLRRKFTLHSFRRFTKTILSDNIGQDYSEWFLGHAKSSYWVRDPEFKAAEYIRIMKFLTFLDYSTLESTGKSIEGKLAGLETENKGLKEELKSLQESQQKSLEQIKEMNKEDNEIQALKDEFRILKEDIRKKAWGEYLDVAKTRSPFLSKKKL